MKSLYVRLVITFILAVLIGLMGAMILTNRMFEQQMQDWMQQDTNSSAEHITAMLSEADPARWGEMLRRFAEMKSSYISLYGADGQRLSGSLIPPGVTQENIALVIAGGRYEVFVQHDNHELPAWLMGYPMKQGDRTYALFIQPNYLEISNEIRRTIQINLSVVLLIGGLVMAVAARYLVNPLNQLTKATRKLAKGNFDIRLNMKRNDEIGILAQSFNEMTVELQQLEQMRQDFVSNVSHEIQTPLTSIIGFTKALRTDSMPEAERLYYLDIIQSESERLSRLSDNLLKLASLTSEHHPFRKTAYRLDEQIRHIVVVCEPQWNAKQLQLDLELPKTVIEGDTDLLSQVWVNLIGNSIKFTPDGGTIAIRLQAEVNRVIVTIQDTGIGIPAAELSMIFHQFYKADRSRTDKVGGSGLGLAIVKKIVDLHKGDLTVTSEEGKGTVCTIVLPSLL
ncbi:sensor histidine kinase [Paenibacillus sp. NPDC056579]|uniref:sensor histidine kinase n=1 Tax=Paenibacillus sp. NPDC056579 TaxID=3345871 RepID=UPI003694DA3A